MNYSGKFDAKVSADGSALHSNGHVHVETVHATHAPADAIIVPDAQLLFNGEFRRSGVDLILSRNDQEQVFHDYFKGEKRAALSSPDGAHLTGDLVNALTGHVEYAQADGSASVSHVIGHVSKLVGTATAIRNGVSVILNNGDNVEKGDVVQSGSNSTLGITFIDGTVFGLSSNARMVLNEMVYDPNGSNNSSLLSLVAGTISFVAGETAKHGDMKVDTPVATMGIRGTAVLVEIDFTVPGQGGTPDAKFQVLVEPDGTTGSYILFDKTTLTPLAVVDKAGLQINISNGILSQTMNPLSPEIQKLITDVFSLKFSDNSNPNTNTHFTDSIVPQGLPPIKLASGATATPFILNVSDTNNSLPSTGPNPPPPVPHIDQPPQAFASGNFTTAHTGTAKSTGFDTVVGPIRFVDINAGDRPTVTTHFVSLKLLDAQHNDITATLTSQQLAAVEAQLVVTASPSNSNNGTATWTYSVADSAFNFLTVGETLTLTYDAVVNNNFLPFEQQGEALFTITINGPSIVEWIHPTGDLWSIGSNWNSGTVPTAADDVIIPAEHIPGGSGLYDVSIVAPAAARTLTLNANNTTGGQVINHSTLTIGEALTIFNDGVLNNLESGTVSVGGQIELLNQSSIQNSGLITLGQGGDFKDQSSVTNSGTIELAGGTLNVDVDIANSGGIIQVDGGTTLKLNGAAINGGTINDNGPIDVTADSSINGTETNALLNNGGVMVESGVTLTLDNVAVNGTIFVDTAAGATIRVDGGTTLTLDDVTVIGGIITDNGTIRVDTEATLTLNGVAINGGTINDKGTIDVTADSSINGTSVDNGEDGTTTVDALLNNGEVTVESDVTLTLDNVTVTGTTFTDTAGGATIQVDSGTTLTLDDVTVTGGTITDNGTIQVDTETTLTLNGVAINGGTINDDGTIDVTADSSINGTATDAVLNNGEVTVESDVTLMLDNVTVNGTTFTDTAGGAILQIGVGTTLTLEGGATIDGGTINDGTAIIDVIGTAGIDSNATLNNGRVTIESGATLALGNVTVNGTAFTGLAASSTIQVDDGDTLTLNSASISGGTVTDNGTIDISGAVTFQSGVAVNGGAMSIAKGATLDIENAVTGTGAILNGVNVINSGTIQVDAPGAGTTVISLMLDGGTTMTGGTLLIHVGFPVGSIEGTVEIGTGGATLDHVTVTNNNSLTIDDGNTLTLSHVTINGGIINAGTFSDGAGGSIDVIGDSSINGITTDNGDGFTTVNATLNNGEVTVESGVTLTLDNVTVNGTVFTGLDTSSIIQVDDSDTLALNGATINGGTINVTGTLDLENATVNGATLGGAGTIATAAGNTDSTLNGITIASGALVTAAVGTLDLTGIITNNGEIDATTGTLDLENATINGGTLGVFGVMDSSGVSFITGATIVNSGNIEVTSGTLTIDPTSVTNTGTIEVTGDSILVLSDDIVTNDGGDIRVDAVPSHTATLDLDGSTINGGTLGIAGLLDSTGDSLITGATITNTGTIDVVSGISTISGTTSFVNAGTVEANGGELDFTNDTLTNTGTLEATNSSVLELTSTTVTNTGGTVTVDAGSTLDLDGGDSITGGTLGNSGTLDATGTNGLHGMAITNDLSATLESTGGVLTIDGSNTTFSNAGLLEANGGELDLTNDTLTNTGTLEATNSSVLELTSTTVTNTGGTVEATGTDGVLNLKGATINGGTVTTAASTDVIEATGGISTISGTSSFVNAGTVEANGAELDLVNTTVTNTSGTVEATGTNGVLNLKGATINGGTVTTAASTDLIAATSGISTIRDTSSFVNNGTLETFGAEVDLVNTTVTNNGSIVVDLAQGLSGTLNLKGAAINGGKVSTAASTDVIEATSGVNTISGTTSFVNVGTVEANGAELDLVNTTVTNTNGTVEAIGTGVLNFKNATINGGTLGGAGTIATATGNTDSTLNGVTIASGALVAAAVGTLDLTGTITNHGEIDAALGGTLDLENATINGGTLDIFGVMDSSGVSFITGATIVNSGNIEVTSGTLTIDPTPVTNTGTIEVMGNGTLVLSGETINNGVNGKIQVDTTSGTLDLENATINGGTLGGAGTIATAAGNIDSTLNGVTIASGSKVTAAVGTLDLTGIITNHGEIDAALGGTLDLENATINGGTLGGAGTIVAVSGDNTLNGVTIANGTKLTTGNLATLDLTGTITNNGEIDATTTKVNIAGNITGTGSIELFNHAKIEIGGSVSSGQTVTFSAPGDGATLILDDSKDFHGKIVGLVEYPNESQENHVDLKDLTFIDHHMSARFDAVTDTVTVSNGTETVTLHLSGGPFDPSFELAKDATGGTLIDDPSASSGLVTIDSGKTLDISVASTATVSFTNSNGNTGELVLDNSKAFTGQIVGFAGDGTISNSDLIDLADVNIADVAINKTTYTDNGNGTGTLTLHDANGQTLDSLTFAGSYQLANFTIENDGSGHTLIVDPPASTSAAVSGVVMNDPGPVASSTIVATAPNQTLSGFAASDNFAFNFAGVGHAIVTDFHPATDTLQFSNPIFASAQAAFDATHDDGHGNSVVAIDAHDTITLAGILKAQLHVGDFHIV